MSKQFHVDPANLTIHYTDANGEHHDLNAEGADIHTAEDLRAFIVELCQQGAFDEDTAQDLDDQTR